MGNFPHAAGLQVQLLAMHRRGPALQKSHMRQKPSKRRTQELEEKPCAPPPHCPFPMKVKCLQGPSPLSWNRQWKLTLGLRSNKQMPAHNPRAHQGEHEDLHVMKYHHHEHELQLHAKASTATTWMTLSDVMLRKGPWKQTALWKSD